MSFKHLDQIVKVHIIEGMADGIRLGGGNPNEHEDIFTKELDEAVIHFGYSPHLASRFSLKITEDLTHQFEECPMVEEGTLGDSFYTRIIQIGEKTLLILYDRVHARSCMFVLPLEFDSYCEKADKIVSLAEKIGWKFVKKDNIMSFVDQ